MVDAQEDKLSNFYCGLGFDQRQHWGVTHVSKDSDLYGQLPQYSFVTRVRQIYPGFDWQPTEWETFVPHESTLRVPGATLEIEVQTPSQEVFYLTAQVKPFARRVTGDNGDSYELVEVDEMRGRCPDLIAHHVADDITPTHALPPTAMHTERTRILGAT